VAEVADVAEVAEVAEPEELAEPEDPELACPTTSKSKQLV